MSDDSHSLAGRIVVVVPAYNEAGAIRNVIDPLTQAYPRVVVVDDGSTDGTAQALVGSAAVVLRHLINRGQGAALQTGIRYAIRSAPAAIVTFDADGQHDVAEVSTVAAPVIHGECDVALGSRFLGRTTDIPFRRKMMLKGAVAFTRLVSRIRVTDAHNGLRAFSLNAARALHIEMDRMAHASEILEQIKINGWSYREVPVTVRYTAYSLAKGQKTREALRVAMHVLLEKLRS